MRTMQAGLGVAISMMAAGSILGCAQDPVRVDHDATRATVAGGTASVMTPASGLFTQTSITSLDVETAGPNTVIHQTAVGAITGTLAGTFTDKLKVVIHPNGKFNAHFTITCVCTVDGKQGVIEIVGGDTGELLSPTLAAFAGRAVINGGTGALSRLRAVLRIEGTVNVTTGIATYGYTGDIHFEP